MKSDKIAKEAIKNIKLTCENMPELYELEIKHWIRMAYVQGIIDYLEEKIKRNGI
jgi:hypothetical protein